MNLPLLLPAAARGVVDPDRPTARRWAVQELTDREYVQAQPGLVDRAIRWVFERVGELLDSAGGAGTGYGLVVGLVVVAAGVVLALLLAGPVRRRARRREAGELFGSQVLSSAEHRGAAEQAARRARWDVAVQERFRAVARALEERVVLDARPGRTADEVAREAGASLPGTGAVLLRAARAFDDVTYGGRPGTEAAYRTCAEADDAVRAARPAHRPAASATPSLPSGAVSSVDAP